MRPPRRQLQSGYALIFLVLGLMGAGGVVLSGLMQNNRAVAEERRYQHNKRVLAEAKRALLMYAYRYPQIALDFGAPTIRGPGRLPCPDTDNNGLPNPLPDCDNAGIPLVGRFPWAADGMEFYDIRDADGERLWYAVSANFANIQTAPDIVNSDSFGTITIYDQSGTTIYDGAADGVAAVIIAPGQPIARDDAPIDGTYEYQQVRNTVAEQADPRNYLDTFTLTDIGPPFTVTSHFDNSIFTNGEDDSDDDNFILGPVFNVQVGDIVMNDQVIVVTTEDVVAMAEKGVLHAYRAALRGYRDTIDTNFGVDRFPWLDPYESDDGLLTYDAVATPAAPVPVLGRMPSIFADYFVNANPNDSESIRPELRLSIEIDGDVYNMSIPAPAAASTFFRANGDLVTQIPNGYTITRYFWDGYKSGLNGPPHPNSPIDFVWEMCPTIDQTPPIVASEDDCNRTVAGTFEGAATDGVSDVWLEVRLVTITFNSITNPIEFAFNDRVDPAPTGIEYWHDSIENPDAQNHVYIAAEFDDAPSYISSFDWSEDEEFLNSFAEEPAGNNGSPTYDAGDSIKVGLPYYPTLPGWVLDNNWHDKVLVTYSSAYQPGGDGACTPAVDDCLTLLDAGGTVNDKIGLLVIAGNVDGDPTDTNDLNDDTNPGVFPYFLDELGDIFEGENNTPDLTYDKRQANATDSFLILD